MRGLAGEHFSLRRGLLGAACVALQPLVLNALSIPVMAFIIRGLGPTSYGQWATSTTLIAACTMLANLGLRASFVRRVALEPQSAATALREQLGLRLLLSILAAGISIAVCIALGYSPIVLRCTTVAAAGLVAVTVATTFVDLLQAMHRLPIVAAVNLVSGLLLTAASVVVVSLKLGPVALSVAYLIGPTTSALLFWYVLRRCGFPVRAALDIPRFREMLSGSRSFTVQQFVDVASLHAHALLLSRLVNPVGFAFFAAGTLLGSRLSVIPDALCTAAYPAVAKEFRRSPARGARVVSRYVVIMLLAGLSTSLAVTLVARPIAQILFPAQWSICHQVILITIWIVPLVGIESIMGSSLNAAGKEAQHARASLVSGALGLIIGLMLVLRFDILGACLASIVTPTIKSLMLAPCFVRTFVLPPAVASLYPLNPRAEAALQG